MIAYYKTLPPAINFGLGATTAQAAANQGVTVWLDTLYNQQVYAFLLQAPGADVTKISDYEYLVSYPQTGTYQVTLEVSYPAAEKSLESNILTINVT
jgi:hypothetical protein